MSGFIDFIKNLFGKESFEDGLIGLAKFNNGNNSLHNEVPSKKKIVKQEQTLSQMLKRS